MLAKCFTNLLQQRPSIEQTPTTLDPESVKQMFRAKESTATSSGMRRESFTTILKNVINLHTSKSGKWQTPCCCKPNNTRDCEEHLFGQVNTWTGCYQLPYSVVQFCTCKDTLAHISGALSIDDFMSYDSLTTI